MHFRLKLRRRPHGGIAPSGDGSGDDLVRGHAVSCGEDSSHAGLVEWRFRLDVSHRARRKSQLLNKGPRRHSQRLMDQELFLLHHPVLQLKDDRVSVGSDQALNNLRLDCPVAFFADCGLESGSECFVSVSVESDVLAQLGRIYRKVSQQQFQAPLAEFCRRQSRLSRMG